MNIANRFLNINDYDDVIIKSLRRQFEYIYCDVFKGTPHLAESKPDYITKMHWSRDWEYPWTIINGEFRKGQRVLDCGCGASPLLSFLSLYGCESYGIDLNYGNYFKKSNLLRRLINKVINRRSPLCNLRHYYTDPNNVLRKKYGHAVHINIIKGSITDMPFNNDCFDRVLCISTLEHLSRDSAFKAIRQMVRVVKSGGLILVTLDHNGTHIKKEMSSSFQDLIKYSGCRIHGNYNWTIPSPEERPGSYDVVGFILKK